VINCGDVLFAIPGRSELVIFNPDTKKYSQVAVLKVSDTPIYAHPVVSGNFIYIKDKESVIKYSIN